MNIDKNTFELMFELEDIEEVQSTEELGYVNMVDISVSGNETFLLSNGIVSHNSAGNSIASILGREGKGYYKMFGVPPNAYDMNLDKILKSDKLKAINKITGLKYSTTHQDTMNFKNIVIATDADLPGFFIRGQLIGLFYKFGKNLIEEGRIKILKTPLFVVQDKKENIITWFYDFESQRKFEAENQNKGYTYSYKKGLSGWDKEELQTVIDKDGYENMLDTLTIGESKEAIEIIDDWLNTKKSDRRKELLEGYEFNILNM